MHGSNVLVDLFLIFALARIAGEIMSRLGQPPVIGELIVGAAFGPHALGILHEGEVVEAIAEIGVVFLLFGVGLENRFSDLRKVGGTSTGVAVSGVVVPFAAGFLLLTLMGGHSRSEALFLGAALVATSVGITARVLQDLGLVRAKESQVILGAAVIDDVLGLLILAVVAGTASGELSPSRLVLLIVEAAVFLGFLATVGSRIMRRHGPLLDRFHLADSPYLFGVTLCLGLSALAGQIGLAAIIGAFFAGMVLAETREHFELEKRIEPVTNFLTPFFFVLTGMQMTPAALTDPSVALLGGVVLLIAIVTKLIPCALASARLGRRSAIIIGTGMVPRGEVGIIVGSIGLASGVVGESVYAVVITMSILSTLVVPPALRVLFREQARESFPPA